MQAIKECKGGKECRWVVFAIFQLLVTKKEVQMSLIQAILHWQCWWSDYHTKAWRFSIIHLHAWHLALGLISSGIRYLSLLKAEDSETPARILSLELKCRSRKATEAIKGWTNSSSYQAFLLRTSARQQAFLMRSFLKSSAELILAHRFLCRERCWESLLTWDSSQTLS